MDVYCFFIMDGELNWYNRHQLCDGPRPGVRGLTSTLLQTINIKENKPATYMTPSQDR